MKTPAGQTIEPYQFAERKPMKLEELPDPEPLTPAELEELEERLYDIDEWAIAHDGMTMLRLCRTVRDREKMVDERDCEIARLRMEAKSCPAQPADKN